MKRGLAIVLLFGFLACGREGELRVATPSPFPTATSTDAPSPSPDASVEPTDAPTASPEAEPTPSPTPERCRDSFDETCGEFVWDPEPGENGKLTVAVSYAPKNPKAGDKVTFTIVAKDDGGTPAKKLYIYGDGTTSGGNYKCVDQDERYGPWTPPDPDPQDNTDTVEYTYENPGVFEATFVYSTKLCDYHGYNPYGSEGRSSVKVNVASES